MNKIADHFIAFFCKKAEAREGVGGGGGTRRKIG